MTTNDDNTEEVERKKDMHRGFTPCTIFSSTLKTLKIQKIFQDIFQSTETVGIRKWKKVLNICLVE